MSKKTIDGSDEIDPPEGQGYKFKYIATYLLNHHRLRFQELNKIDQSYLWIAMIIVILTLSIRVIFLILR